MLQLAVDAKNELYEAKAHYLKGYIYNSKKDWKEACVAYSHALYIFIRLDQKEDTNKTFVALAVIFEKTQSFKTAIKLYKMSEPYFKKQKQNEYLKTVYFGMGKSYRQIKSYDSSAIVLNKYLELAKASEDYEGQYRAYNQLGILSKEIKQYALAIEYYFSALENIKEEKVYNKRRFSVYNNVGAAYFKQGDYVKAKSYLLKSLSLEREYPAKIKTILNANFNLGSLYEQEGNMDSAEYYYSKVLELSQLEDGLKEGKHFFQSVKKMSEIYNAEGDIDMAYKVQNANFNQLMAVVDKKEDLERMSTKIQGELLFYLMKLEEQKQKRDDEKKKAMYFSIMSYSVIGCILVITFLVLRRYSVKMKKNDSNQNKGVVKQEWN